MKKRDLVMDDITTLYEVHAQGAVNLINRHPGEEMLPQLLAVEVGERPGTLASILLIDPNLVNALHQSDETKDLMMHFVHALLHRGDDLMKSLGRTETFTPDAVVHICEAWAVSRRDSLDVLDCYASVSEHPDRTEVVVVNVHTPDRTYSGWCPITGSGTERRALFKPLDLTGVATGRLILHGEDEYAKH